MFTIPVEDILWISLIMSNCLLFDYFKYGTIKRISNYSKKLNTMNIIYKYYEKNENIFNYL